MTSNRKLHHTASSAVTETTSLVIGPTHLISHEKRRKIGGKKSEFISPIFKCKYYTGYVESTLNKDTPFTKIRANQIYSNYKKLSRKIYQIIMRIKFSHNNINY